MVSQTPTALSGALRQKVEAIEHASAGLSDADARRRPADGEWSIAEILSHLCGGDGSAFLSTVRRFIDEDKPVIEIVPGISHFESRKNAPVSELMASFRSQYNDIVSYLAGLSEAQLHRTAHVALLKDTPFGEHPTLEQFATVISDFHMGGHVAQIGEIRKTIGV